MARDKNLRGEKKEQAERSASRSRAKGVHRPLIAPTLQRGNTAPGVPASGIGQRHGMTWRLAGFPSRGPEFDAPPPLRHWPAMPAVRRSTGDGWVVCRPACVWSLSFVSLVTLAQAWVYGLWNTPSRKALPGGRWRVGPFSACAHVTPPVFLPAQCRKSLQEIGLRAFSAVPGSLSRVN